VNAIVSNFGPETLRLVDVHIDALQPGWLWHQFQSGVHAVTLETGQSLLKAWNELVAGGNEVLPWLAPLSDIAANHYGTADITLGVGDVFYLQPRMHGYIGRKLVIETSAGGRRRVFPATFRQGEDRVSPSPVAVEECCRIADTIMRSLSPRDGPSKDYRIALQRLKYQPSPSELNDLLDLTHNSLARWSRLGVKIDRNRGELSHRFSGRWVSDALGLLMEMPGGRAIVAGLTRMLDPERAAGPAKVIERAHVDERYFSAILSDRATVRTEIFANGRWHRLPVGLQRLTILPGSIASRELGIAPALHRVVYSAERRPESINPRSGNVTLLIGAF